MATPSIPQSKRSGALVSGSLTLPFAVSLFTFAVCYFRSFIFPDIPLLPSGDQTGFVYAGNRIVSGQLPYRDYFQIVPPGTDLTYALLVKLFGLHNWISLITMVVLATISAFLLTLISMRVLRGRTAALPGLFLAAYLLAESLDGTHHWFSMVFALAALLLMLDATTSRRIALAGAWCGLTACFTQTKGAAILGGFIVYSIWKAGHDGEPARVWLRQSLILCGAAAVLFFAVNAHFIVTSGLGRWLFCVVVYPLRYYPIPEINNWHVILYDFGWHGGMGRWIAYPFVYATVPLAAIGFLLTTRRRWRDGTESWPQLVLIAITAIFLFLAVASSPSLKRLGAVGPPSMVPLAWLISRPGRFARAVSLVLILGAIALAIGLPLRAQTRWQAFLDLPAGRTAFQDRAVYQEYGWIREHTHPGQLYFGLPLYVPFHLVNPAKIEGMHTSDYTRPSQVTELLQSLDAPVPMMILPPSQKFPRATGLPTDHLGPYRDYLCRNYQLTRILPAGDEAWERRATPIACPPQ